MNRRKFISKSIKASLLTGAIAHFGIDNILGNINSKSDDYDLVAIKGSGPEAMFDKGIKAMGGMDKYVKPGQSVVVKPNIGWDATPEEAANTNPHLVRRIIEHCFEAGADKVYVFDNTCNEWTRCYKNSGIKDEVGKTPAKLVSGKNKADYKKQSLPNARILKNADVHELIIDTDVFINVPVLKDHGGAKLTIAMKNLMGVIWDRRFWHSNGLDQCIADFPTYRKPDLNVVDAYRVMKKNGPQGVSVNDVVTLKSQLISSDIVAIDAAATKIFGLEPSEVKYIKIAHEMGLGNMNLEELNINKIKL
jgi:uncharacterized protein (DUF362 family)